MGLPVIDIKDLPLVRITYPALLTEVDVDSYADHLGRVLERSPIGTVVDIRVLDPSAVGAAHRKYLASAIDGVTQAHAGRLVAEAIVMNSAVLRGLYTAYCWIRKDTSYRSKAFRTCEEAETWVRRELEAKEIVSS